MIKLRHLFAAVLALVAILWFQGAQADILDDLKAEGVVVLYHDYRAGHMLDLSGNSNHGTGTDISWTGDGARLPASTSRITVADSGELQLTTGALIVYSADGFMSQVTYERLISKRDSLGNTNYDFRLTATGGGDVQLYDGTNTRALVTNVVGKHCIAVNMADGGTGEVFVDGLSAGVLDGASDISVDVASVIIGNLVTGITRLRSTLSAALIINRPLTDTEMAQTCAALQSYKFPTMTRAEGQGSYGVEVLTDGDMEAGGTANWTPGGGAIETKELGGAMAGSQVLRITKDAAATDYVYQTATTSGTRYRVTGWARGDGTANPRISGSAYHWTGTTSTNWQPFDFVQTWDSTKVYLNAYGGGAANWVEFDNISVTEIESDHVQYKTEWGATASNTNITGGPIEGTPFWVSTGTWKVTTDTVDGETVKVLENVVAGVAYLDTSEIEGSPTADAYGTWEFWLYKIDASSPYVGIIADTIGAYNAAGQDAYWLGLDSDEKVQLGESTAAAWSLKFNTAAAYFSHSTWYQYRVTRSDDGIFTVYQNGVIVDASGGAGTNPVTDATTATSSYIVLDLDAGDKIALSGPTGDQCFWKAQGVIAP